MFILELAVPLASTAPVVLTTPTASSAPFVLPVSSLPCPSLEASCYAPANASDLFAFLCQQKLASLKQWRASIVMRIGAKTATTILADIEATLPSITVQCQDAEYQVYLRQQQKAEPTLYKHPCVNLFYYKKNGSRSLLSLAHPWIQ